MAHRRRIAGSMLVALPAVIVAGCGSGSGRGGGSSSAPRSTVLAAASARPAGVAEDSPVGAQSAGPTVVSAAGDAATRIVRTGSLSLTVATGRVGATMDRLTAIAAADGGYVESSRADGTGAASSGSVTLRVPTARFAATLTAARRLGHVTSVTTSADDVTGRYVDLTARRAALVRTRSTYLTILSRATTIGATLAVQQRVDDVQQQVERLTGELKLLRNQSSDATLTVDVVTATAAKRQPPARTGIGAAWHRSWQRFLDGIEAVVGALGPIALALILLALAGLVARAIYRRARPIAGRLTR